MHEGKIVFSQLMDHLPLQRFRRCVDQFDVDHSVKSFSCQDQFRCMAFGQLTYRDSLRDTVTCLNAQQAKLWSQQLQIAVYTAPNAIQQTVKSHDLKMVSQSPVHSKNANWTDASANPDAE